MLRGGCYCGATGYEVADEFRYAMNCHCSQCRRTTGAACKPFAGIDIGKISMTQGQETALIVGEADAAHDVHCGACGSLLYSVVRENAFAHVAMGTLIDPPSIRPQMHIMVGSKATWHDITDDLPQFEAFPE
jgi:hypothetical protein